MMSLLAVDSTAHSTIYLSAIKLSGSERSVEGLVGVIEGLSMVEEVPSFGDEVLAVSICCMISLAYLCCGEYPESHGV